MWWIAEDHPELPAVAAAPSTPGALTFAELIARAHRAANALLGAGLERGDCIALLLPNDVPLLEWTLAAEEIGLYFVMLNPHLSANEIAGVLETSESKVLVGHERYRALVGTAAQVLCVGEVDGATSVDTFLAPHPATPPPNRSAGQMYPFSSGTTGRPKGVRRPLPEGDPSAQADRDAIFGKAFAFQRGGCHLVSAGMHHGGCRSFYRGALNSGQSLVILPKFDAEATLRAIEEHRVTTAYMVPTQFYRLLQLPEKTRAKYDVSSLEVVVHSAAPCPASIKQRMLDWWGPVIWETYGGMEGAATIAKPHRWLEKPGTVGRSVRGVSVSILDDDDRELPANEIGHVYIDYGERLFAYAGDPGATEDVYRDTRFTIGDMGYLDDDGYLFIADRKKDMIISGGVNIFPAEIESVLLEHDRVADVAVIGVPDPEWGEQVKAVVVAANGAPSPDELIEHCRGRLAKYKCPKSVDFRDELPRSDTGKLFKRRLRDEYWAGHDRKV